MEYCMTDDIELIDLRGKNDDFLKSVKSMLESSGPLHSLDTVLDELIRKWYPELSKEEAYVLKHVIHMVHDIGFTAAPVDELEVRILDECTILKDIDQIDQVVEQICKKGIVKSVMTKYTTRTKEGIIWTSPESKHLVMDERFQYESENQIVNCILRSYVNNSPSPVVVFY